MTSRERVLAAFAHRPPDRVPAWCGASPEFRDLACRHLGLPDDESLSLHVGDDFRPVYARFAGPDSRSPGACLAPAEATSRTPFGIERRGYGYGQSLEHPLVDARTRAEIEEYSWPNPDWMDISPIRWEALVWKGQFAVLGGKLMIRNKIL